LVSRRSLYAAPISRWQGGRDMGAFLILDTWGHVVGSRAQRSSIYNTIIHSYDVFI